MQTLTADALDMSELMNYAYELGDMINESTETADYIYWKQQVEQQPEVKQVVNEFTRCKERFEECQRFGHFHPNYHEALAAVQAAEAKLHTIEAVSRFKQAEQQLDDLLYTISTTLAHSVSESILVPSNDPGVKSGGCGSGGSCSGKCS